MVELWADIPGYLGYYQISTMGRVRSCVALSVKRNRYEPGHPWRILKLNFNKRMGYLTLQVTARNAPDGIPKRFEAKIHRLMWEVFKGEIPKEFSIDHTNGDFLDNRLENLRLATAQQQHRNRGRKENKKLGKYKGVFNLSAGRNLSKPWVAKITINRKPQHLGYFATEIEAAAAYNEAARRLFREFARLNIIESEIA